MAPARGPSAPGASPSVLRTAVLTLLALVAFASNSLLTRLALGAGEIDAATFTAIRLAAGAIVLVAIVRVRDGGLGALRGGGVVGPLALFAYAAPFSFAYVRIGAAVGALVAFGCVQITMVGAGLIRGERPSARTWLGLALATGGLLGLTLPSVNRPDPIGVASMAVAGLGWGIYSLAGRASREPIAANARSFVWSSGLALLLVALSAGRVIATTHGAALAAISGAVTSGIGYVIWYRALPRLSVTQAAVAQVCTPILAALGATALLGEPVSPRLVAAGIAVVGGVALVMAPGSRTRAA
jgi:drug/metabolite transporter (DMT)-like permease